MLSNLLNYSARYSGSGTPHHRDRRAASRRRGREGQRYRHWHSTGDVGKLSDLITQIKPSLEPAQRGLGLGLTFVKQLVTIHGGTVEARREGAGKGAEFVVRLPLNSASAHEDGQSALIAEVSDSGRG
ncbi:MAG TPA: ATP-binding protein [Gammaproteobacteria bacterium]|nr:ATP-binding protein [Gammaproteobacteria bacterium]